MQSTTITHRRAIPEANELKPEMLWSSADLERRDCITQRLTRVAMTPRLRELLKQRDLRYSNWRLFTRLYAAAPTQARMDKWAPEACGARDGVRMWEADLEAALDAAEGSVAA